MTEIRVFSRNPKFLAENKMQREARADREQGEASSLAACCSFTRSDEEKLFFIFYLKKKERKENEYIYMYSYSYSYGFVGQAPRMRIFQSMLRIIEFFSLRKLILECYISNYSVHLLILNDIICCYSLESQQQLIQNKFILPLVLVHVQIQITLFTIECQ